MKVPQRFHPPGVGGDAMAQFELHVNESPHDRIHQSEENA
jgi:hypothetical protein